MKTMSVYLAVAAAIAFSAGGVHGANPTAMLNIQQWSGSTWSENISGLLVVDAQDNFTLRQGSGTSGIYQNGSFVDSVSTAGNYWQWGNDLSGGYWNWHSTDVVDSTKPVGADNPWMSVLNLKSVSGHGDPDIAYAFSAFNNTASNQTYTFTVGEAIFPTVSGANTVYSDISGGLTTKDGNVTVSPVTGNTVLQRFQLSADNGLSFVDAGVGVGSAATASGTVTYGPYNSPATFGPAGSWNYIQMVNSFVLTPKDGASFAGYASITAVPEPKSLAMLLTGMGLMVTMVRRRSV